MITRKRTKLLAIMVLPIVAIACGFSAATSQPLSPTQALAPTQASSEPRTTGVSYVTNEEVLLEELYNRANPSVVNIITYQNNGRFTMPAAQGSGFVYDNEGHIVTNAHVIHGAEEIEVVFWDDTRRMVELVGEDLHSDLAVIKVDSMPEGITPLALGDIDSVSVGQTVVAIGNPFGLGGTLTKGIVSALGRTIPALTPFAIPQAIQTDAPINPGNSGGPLLNLNGEVIGVNAQIETGSQGNTNSGIGFAIPVSIVARVVPKLISDQEYTWSWVGVSGSAVSPSLVKAMDLPVEKGAYIVEVYDGGPAAKAKLRGATRQTSVDGHPVQIGGDIIVAINGQPVNSFDDLLIYISMNAEPGQTVTLTIVRDGKFIDVEVTLEPRPSDQSVFSIP